MTEMEPAEYASTLEALKTSGLQRPAPRPTHHQQRAPAAVVDHLGRTILTRQAEQGWGTKILARFAEGLRAKFPTMKGLSRANLFYMFLALSLDSGEAATVGQWQADAGLTLRPRRRRSLARRGQHAGRCATHRCGHRNRCGVGASCSTARSDLRICCRHRGPHLAATSRPPAPRSVARARPGRRPR